MNDKDICSVEYCGRPADGDVCQYHVECSACTNRATKCDDHASQSCSNCGSDNAKYCSSCREEQADCANCGDSSSASYCYSCYSSGKEKEDRLCQRCYTNIDDVAIVCATCSKESCGEISSAGVRCLNAPIYCSSHFSEKRWEDRNREETLARRERDIADRELAIKREAMKLALEMLAQYDIPNPFRVKSERRIA